MSWFGERIPGDKRFSPRDGVWIVPDAQAASDCLHYLRAASRTACSPGRLLAGAASASDDHCWPSLSSTSQTLRYRTRLPWSWSCRGLLAALVGRYDDNLEHSTRLSLMDPRLELLRDLLAEVDREEWLGARVLTDAEGARIEERFRGVGDQPARLLLRGTS
jgi:hypothetical protein